MSTPTDAVRPAMNNQPPVKSMPAIAPEPSQQFSNRELYAAYLGEKNQDYYLNKFEEFDRRGDGVHISWNWPAFITFLFGATWWALYRKLYAWFFALLVYGSTLLAITYSRVDAIAAFAFVFSVASATAFGMFANVIYYRGVKAKISAAQSIARNDDDLMKLLIKKGGVHSWVWRILWVWLAVLIIGIITAIAIPAYNDYTKKAKAQASGNVPQLSTETRNPPASTDKTGWVKLLCSGSSGNATVFKFNEEARLAQIDGAKSAYATITEDYITVLREIGMIDSRRNTFFYRLNRVSGDLQIIDSLNVSIQNQHCRLSETNKF